MKFGNCIKNIDYWFYSDLKLSFNIHTWYLKYIQNCLKLTRRSFLKCSYEVIIALTASATTCGPSNNQCKNAQGYFLFEYIIWCDLAISDLAVQVSSLVWVFSFRNVSEVCNEWYSRFFNVKKNLLHLESNFTYSYLSLFDVMLFKLYEKITHLSFLRNSICIRNSFSMCLILDYKLCCRM